MMKDLEKRKNPEQDLIKSFCNRVGVVKYSNCRAKNYADIEYINDEGEFCMVEAKTHLSGDGHNAVHKLFGELLKLTGYQSSKTHENIKYQLLIDNRPDETGKRGGQFFHELLVKHIPKDKFIAFGKIVPIDKVIEFDMKTIKEFSWEEFYNLEEK